jgi:non-ribosomal peptide synthetase component E (peptide arylation enzyme)
MPKDLATQLVVVHHEYAQYLSAAQRAKIKYCTERLAKFKVPRRIYTIVLEDIPTTGPGKVKKKDLVEFAQRLGSDVTVERA